MFNDSFEIIDAFLHKQNIIPLELMNKVKFKIGANTKDRKFNAFS